jgi:S1-C subfamily serine protease
VTEPPPQPPPAEGGEGPIDGHGEESEAPLRGWIDPDDRLWRHPSELAGTRTGASGGPAPAPTRHRYRDQLTLLVGAAAIMAAVAGVVFLLSPASDRPASAPTSDVASDAPMTTLAGSPRTIPSVAEAAGNALVQLRATTAHGVVLLTGVAVAEGGLVATTADRLHGLRALSMVGPHGRLLPASIMAVDRDSDVALVNVPDDIPVAPFADDTTLAAGAPDLTLSLLAVGGSVPSLHCVPGSVAAVGTALVGGPADGMPAIVSTAPVLQGESGDPLLNASGDVIGLLYDDDAAPLGAQSVTFLPTELVLGVADDLRSTGRVAHGWLGVAGTTNAAGALVVSILAGSPAAGHLQAGDVIVGVDDAPVRSMAELRARLYVLAPNDTVTLSVLRGTVRQDVDVTLGTRP